MLTKAKYGCMRELLVFFITPSKQSDFHQDIGEEEGDENVPISCRAGKIWQLGGDHVTVM